MSNNNENAGCAPVQRAAEGESVLTVTIGDLILRKKGVPASQELWEARLGMAEDATHAFNHARHKIEELMPRLNALKGAFHKAREYLEKLKDMEQSGEANNKMVRAAEEHLRAERVRLTANPEVQKLERELRALHAVMNESRARMRVNPAPMEAEYRQEKHV